MSDISRPLGKMAQLLPEPIILADTDARIVDVNPAAAALLGESADSVRQRRLSEFLLTSHRDLQQYLHLCASTHQIVPGRLRTTKHESGFRCEGAVFSPASGDSGAVVFLRLRPHEKATERFRLLTDRIEQLGRQVELRMRTEQVLDSQRQVLEAIAHEQPLADVLELLASSIDRQSAAGARSSVLLYNPRDNTLRHGAAPALPQHYSDAIDGLVIGPDVGSCGTAAFLNETVCTEDIMTDPKWEAFRGLAQSAGVRACFSTPITGASDEVLGTFALYYDVPRLPDLDDRRVVALLARTAALAIERSRAGIEIRALLEREREARGEAEEANRSKDEFLAMVSHELRNPLNAILGWARVLTTDGIDDETLEKGLDAIERNAALQAQLISEILDYSRITAGKLRLEIAPTDISELLQSAVDSARPTATIKSVELLTDMSELEPAQVALDPSRIQQVVDNLLSNAIKFTPEGGQVTLRASTQRKHLKIIVEDTGCGIDAKFLPYVFDRFRQQERTQQSAHEGLGLGLAIVRHIVELHHGKISATSEGRGKGARFEVLLPRRFSWNHQRDRQHADIVDLANVGVLAVDDAADTRALLQTLFSTAGAKVRVAATGFEALEALKKQRPDVLLCDIGMPGMDGYEVVEQLRKLEGDEAGHRVTAIALTAYARGRDRQRALDAGFDAHMAKPVDPAQLLRLVAESIVSAANGKTKKPAV